MENNILERGSKRTGAGPYHCQLTELSTARNGGQLLKPIATASAIRPFRSSEQMGRYDGHICRYGSSRDGVGDQSSFGGKQRSARSRDGGHSCSGHQRPVGVGLHNASTARPMAFALSHTLAPHIWNNLPQDIRHSATLSSFKSELKTFLFSEYFG